MQMKYSVALLSLLFIGISSFTSTPTLAFQSLVPLLDFASSHIPLSKHSQTVLYILCTAGMRLLPQLQQNVIIHSLKEAVPQQYPFHLPKDGIQVIPGKMEGTYSHDIMSMCSNK